MVMDDICLDNLRWRCMRAAARLSLSTADLRSLALMLERIDVPEFGRSQRLIVVGSVSRMAHLAGLNPATIRLSERKLRAAGMATLLHRYDGNRISVHELHPEPLQPARTNHDLPLRMPRSQDPCEPFPFLPA
jgi:hypothetical protein